MEAYKNSSSNELLFLVPGTGLEPARYCYQGILSPRCLPFHHPGDYTIIIYHLNML